MLILGKIRIALLVSLFATIALSGTSLQKPQKRCSISKENLYKTKETSFKAFVEYDPGENVMLDPKNCKHEPIECYDEGKDSIVVFPMTCPLLHSAPKTPKDMTPTRTNHSFKIRIKVTPEGEMTILKQLNSSALL